MRDLQRLAAATGIAGVVLFVVSVLVVPTPPRFSAQDTSVSNYLDHHASALRGSQYIAGIALFALIWFIGTLWSHLRRWEGPSGRLATVFLVSAIGLGTVFLVQAGMVVVASYAPGDPVSIGFFRLSDELAPHAAFLVAPMFASVGLVILRQGGLPRTLGWYCLAVAGYELIEGACILTRTGALSPGGTVNRVGPLLFVLWGIWTSGALVRTIGSAPAQAPAAAAG